MLFESPQQTDIRFMQAALQEAEDAAAEGEVPVGAVIVSAGRIIARTHNLTERLTDPTAHAEMLAITAATQHLGGKYLHGCTLYVTVEPCTMCAGALAWSQISRIVYGASDPKRGYSRLSTSDNSPIFHPKTIITNGILADECAEIMTRFFKQRR